MTDRAYDRDAEVIDPEDLQHPRGDDRYAYGLNDPDLPSIPALLRELDYLHSQAQQLQGGAKAASLGPKISGASSQGQPESSVLRDQSGLERTLHNLHIELLRVRRRYTAEILGQGVAGNTGSMDRRLARASRIKHAYPPHWRSYEIGLVEECSERHVRELRGSDRERRKVA